MLWRNPGGILGQIKEKATSYLRGCAKSQQRQAANRGRSESWVSDMVVGLGPGPVTVPSSGMQFPHLDKVGAGLNLCQLCHAMVVTLPVPGCSL